MTIRSWLKPEISDESIESIIRDVATLVDLVHKCPPPEMFAYFVTFYGQTIGPFHAEGCDVAWSNGILPRNVAGCFVPISDRVNYSKALILLSEEDPTPQLTLMHEVGHLVHTTFLAALPSRKIENFRRVLEQNTSFIALKRIALEKQNEYAFLEKTNRGDARNTETGILMTRASYDASYAEWFCRVYVWLICRKIIPLREQIASVDFKAIAIDGKTRIYPPVEQLDQLADVMKQMFAGFR